MTEFLLDQALLLTLTSDNEIYSRQSQTNKRIFSDFSNGVTFDFWVKLSSTQIKIALCLEYLRTYHG